MAAPGRDVAYPSCTIGAISKRCPAASTDARSGQSHDYMSEEHAQTHDGAIKQCRVYLMTDALTHIKRDLPAESGQMIDGLPGVTNCNHWVG